MMQTWTTEEIAVEKDEDGDIQVTIKGAKDDGANWFGQFYLVESSIEILRDKLTEYLDANRD